MMSIQDDMKKVLLAGLGAVAFTAEKSKELVDEFVKRGQITVDQAKVLNEELRKCHEKKPEAETAAAAAPSTNLVDQLSKMSAEEIEALKAKLAEMENTKHEAEEAGK